MYGDVSVVTLPASKIVVLISSRYHERAPGDLRLAFVPDVPLEVGCSATNRATAGPTASASDELWRPVVPRLRTRLRGSDPAPTER